LEGVSGQTRRKPGDLDVRLVIQDRETYHDSFARTTWPPWALGTLFGMSFGNFGCHLRPKADLTGRRQGFHRPGRTLQKPAQPADCRPYGDLVQHARQRMGRIAVQQPQQCEHEVLPLRQAEHACSDRANWRSGL
jgi:hypothetical protein